MSERERELEKRIKELEEKDKSSVLKDTLGMLAVPLVTIATLGFCDFFDDD